MIYQSVVTKVQKEKGPGMFPVVLRSFLSKGIISTKACNANTISLLNAVTSVEDALGSLNQNRTFKG